MTLIQQARALESRIEALEARSGHMEADRGLMSELRELKGAATRLGVVEAALIGLPAVEKSVAELLNQGDLRPVADELSRRVADLERIASERHQEHAAALQDLQLRLDALTQARRFKPMHGLVWLLSTAAAGVVAWRNGMEPLMVLGVTVAAGIFVGALLRSGD